MPEYVILNKRDKVVQVFTAADNLAARAVLRAKVSEDGTEYTLARKLARASVSVVVQPATINESSID